MDVKHSCCSILLHNGGMSTRHRQHDLGLEHSVCFLLLHRVGSSLLCQLVISCVKHTAAAVAAGPRISGRQTCIQAGKGSAHCLYHTYRISVPPSRMQLRQRQIEFGDREIFFNEDGEKMSKLREVDADWVLRRLERWWGSTYGESCRETCSEPLHSFDLMKAGAPLLPYVLVFRFSMDAPSDCCDDAVMQGQARQHAVHGAEEGLTLGFGILGILLALPC